MIAIFVWTLGDAIAIAAVIVFLLLWGLIYLLGWWHNFKRERETKGRQRL